MAESTPPELYLNLGMEPATLDPAQATDPGSQQIDRMIFLSLVDTDPTTGGPQHALAVSWAVSADGLMWEFKLRSDAEWVRYDPSLDRFEVKRPVTADDVVYSVRRVFDPRVGSGFAPMFAPLIRGAEQLRAADPKQTPDSTWDRLFANLGVQKVDDTMVRFTLTRPASYFPIVISNWLVRTQPKESVEAGEAVWTEPGTLWTDGPYVLESWSHNREIVLRKNPYWYDAASVQIDRIHFAMIGNPTVALQEYKAGNLDSLDPYGGLSPSDVSDLKEDPVYNKQLQIVPTLCTQYYGFNTSKPPFDNVQVRQAFAAAIDRDTLVSSVVRLGEPARWFTRPGVYASSTVSDTLGIPFNATAARDLLKQAGYDSRTLPPINLVVNTNDLHQLVAETIVQMWKNNLGVEVRVTQLDWKRFTESLGTDPPQIFRLGWCAYMPDASNFDGSVFRSGSTDNYTRWASPAVDQALDAAARETDVAKRVALYRSVDKTVIVDNAIVVPLWWTDRATLTRPNVQRTYAITDGYDRLETWSMQ